MSKLSSASFGILTRKDYTSSVRSGALSHVTAACCHMFPRRAVTCPSVVLSHDPAACRHMSPPRAVTCPRGVLSHATSACCHMFPRRAVTCPRGLLSHVPSACCHTFLSNSTFKFLFKFSVQIPYKFTFCNYLYNSHYNYLLNIPSS